MANRLLTLYETHTVCLFSPLVSLNIFGPDTLTVWSPYYLAHMGLMPFDHFKPKPTLFTSGPLLIRVETCWLVHSVLSSTDWFITMFVGEMRQGTFININISWAFVDLGSSHVGFLSWSTWGFYNIPAGILTSGGVPVETSISELRKSDFEYKWTSL